MPFKDPKRKAAQHKIYMRGWYQRNKKKHQRLVRRRHKAILDYLRTYKANHPCVDCGEPDPIVLDFDHVNGKKESGLARVATLGWGWEKIKKEIAKCVIRCANCHRRRTARTWLKRVEQVHS